MTDRTPPLLPRWPFARSPGDVAEALRQAHQDFDGDMLAAVRNVFIEYGEPLASAAPPAAPQAEPQPEAIPIAPVEVVRQALKELLESISECRMDQVTARFAKASVMARAVVDRYKDAT